MSPEDAAAEYGPGCCGGGYDDAGSTGVLIYGFTPNWGATPHYMVSRRVIIGRCGHRHRLPPRLRLGWAAVGLGCGSEGVVLPQVMGVRGRSASNDRTPT